MRLVLWVLALFVAAVAVALVAKDNTGHAILVMPPYEIELSFSMFIVWLAGAFFAFYIVLWLIMRVFGYKHRKAEHMLFSGLNAFFEGDFVQAKKNAAVALRLSDSSITKVISAVVAARSAHQLDEISLRDKYLATAEKEAPEERSLRLVTQAELLLKDGRHEEALEALQLLYSTGGLQQTSVLKLELEAQKQAQNWDAVIELANILVKRHHINKASIEQLKHDAHLENIKHKASDVASLNKYWVGLSPVEKNNSKLTIAITRAYMNLGDCSTAHKIIERSINEHWDDGLIALYAECLDYHVNRQIECAEVWLKSRPNNAQLLLTLGKLCTHCELWGKAQSYLEASLSVEPGLTAHFALAQLNEKLGKHELATDHYNKGIGFALKDLG
ncbi:MAG: heme biosynthesis protein HemY [Nitrosomonas sp.]|nr:heme biosynthesis protein HemY [Nitrosomonas sp.]